MSSVGAYLRGLRERQGMSVDELSRATRVLHHYLEALESDDLAALPAPVFTKGFIRAYCQAVGVAPDEALQFYDRGAGRRPEPPKVPIVAAPPIIASAPEPDDFPPIVTRVAASQSEPRESRSRGTLLVSVILLVVLGAAFFAVTMTLRSSRDGDGAPSERAALPEPPPADESSVATQAGAPVESFAPAPVAALPAASPPAIAPTPKPAPSAAPSLPAPTSVPATPVPPALPAASSAPTTVSTVSPASGTAGPAARNPAAPYRLIARTTETTWMRVRTEDGRTSEETIPANEIREWISNGPFIITIGNAGGVSLELNGRPVPRLGASGSVITRLVLPSDNQ
jgi:cytoskeleton protein RodZ